jgi:hypothetical protein
MSGSGFMARRVRCASRPDRTSPPASDKTLCELQNSRQIASYYTGLPILDCVPAVVVSCARAGKMGIDVNCGEHKRWWSRVSTPSRIVLSLARTAPNTRDWRLSPKLGCGAWSVVWWLG